MIYLTIYTLHIDSCRAGRDAKSHSLDLTGTIMLTWEQKDFCSGVTSTILIRIINTLRWAYLQYLRWALMFYQFTVKSLDISEYASTASTFHLRWSDPQILFKSKLLVACFTLSNVCGDLSCVSVVWMTQFTSGSSLGHYFKAKCFSLNCDEMRFSRLFAFW